jgi:ribosome-binding factor A
VDPITQARINSQMMETLAALLARQVRDPRVEAVTLTGVEVTNDLAVAKVYYSLLGDAQAKSLAQRGLENSAGFLRREIGRRMHLRNAPQLRFQFDASLEQGQRIETLLREWHDEKPDDAGEGRENDHA